jgi:hypothetical protein
MRRVGLILLLLLVCFTGCFTAGSSSTYREVKDVPPLIDCLTPGFWRFRQNDTVNICNSKAWTILDFDDTYAGRITIQNKPSGLDRWEECATVDGIGVYHRCPDLLSQKRLIVSGITERDRSEGRGIIVIIHDESY